MNKTLGGPQGQSGRFGREKNPLPLPGTELHFKQLCLQSRQWNRHVQEWNSNMAFSFASKQISQPLLSEHPACQVLRPNVQAALSTLTPHNENGSSYKNETIFFLSGSAHWIHLFVAFKEIKATIMSPPFLPSQPTEPLKSPWPEVRLSPFNS